MMNGTGLGVRIGVIDSGVHRGHSHIGAVAGGIAIAMTGEVTEDYQDRLGHGTAVMAAIQEKVPEATYFAVKVFGDALKTKADCLVRAIDWCLEQNIDVINLSLGTMNAAHIDAFTAAIARAKSKGALLVSAREANGALCYPGSLPDVINVDVDWDCPRESYTVQTVDGRDLYYASGYPRPVPGVPPQRNLYGISFAVANMSAFVARACEQHGNSEPQNRFAMISEALRTNAK